jgi:hypothetical protein
MLFNLRYNRALFLRWGETKSLWDWAANGPSVHPPDDTRVNMEHRWNDINRGKPKDSEKSCPSATLSTTSPTWTALSTNQGLRDEKPATNRMSYGTAYDRA